MSYPPRRVTRLCEICQKEFSRYTSEVSNGRGRFCSYACSGISIRQHPIIEYDNAIYYLNTSSGYYVDAKTNMKLHRVIWSNHHGPIPEGFVVHHRNENKTDNRLENLELIEWAEHTSLHSKERWRTGKPMGHGKPRSICSFDGCKSVSRARQLCTKHYQRHMTALKRGNDGQA